MAQNNFLQSPFDALATATEESIYSLPPLPGQKSSTPTQVSEVPRDTRAPAVEQPEEPVAGQPVKAMPGQYLPPAQLRPVFEAAAREFNVPVNVLMSLAYQESTYNPAAIGQPTKYGRAKGIMQYIDSTANGLGINPFDPNQAVPAAARQLRERLDKGYSFQDAIRAHHGGDNRKQWGPITEDYVQKVWGRAGQIGEELGAGSPPAAAADPLAEMNKAEPGRYRVATPEEVAAFEKKQAAMTEAEQAKEAEAQKELGVLDTTAMLGKQLWDAAAYHLPGSIAAAMEGDDPFAEKDWKDKLIERSRNRARESTKLGDDKRQTAIPGISAQDIKSLGPSLGFSVTGMGAGFGVGVPATAAGTLVAPGVGTGAGIVAGGTASGVTAYRMATNSFVRDLRELADLDAKKQGKPPLSDAEFAEKMKGIQGAVTEYGLWEALPEAASNVVGFGVLKAPVKSAIGKYFGKNVLTRLGTKAAAVYGSELSTETVTQQGQNNVMADVGQQFGLKGENEVNRRSWTSAADLGESFSEIAPTTILQTTLLAGGTKSAMILSDRIKRGNLSREQYDALMELNDLVERGQFDPEGARLEAVRRLDPNNAQLAEVPQANQGPATDGIVIPPAGGRDRDEAEKARRAASGPLTRSVERVADDAATEKRVTVAGPQGQITGFVESYQEDGQGGFVARVLGDDGQVYTFTSADGVSITPLAPEPVGPLTAAVEQVAAAQPDVAPSIPAGPALWKNSEFDVPVRVIGVEQQAGADGRFYARVEQNGVESFIPADEIAPAPVAQPVADAGDQQPAEPVSQPATSVAVTEEGAGVSQPPQAAPTLAEMDEPALRERLKYIASQGKANGWNKLLMNARREVEAEINKRTEGAKTDERADSVGVRVPDVSEGSVQADAPRGTDQPAGREGDAQLRDGVQADSGPAVPADGNAVPAAGAAADRQPALTPKRAAALDRIAKGTAFFGTPEKADAFIAKNEVGDTHEVVQTGKVRFEVKAKAPATAKESSSVQADATPAIIPAGGTTTADEREPKQSKKQSKVLPREMDEDGRAKDGKPINPGDVFKTLSGRETSPYPKQKSERYASEWLIENAASEAESRGDKFNSSTFRATKPNKSGGLTTADRESMLMYLFGYQPDVVPSILKPLAPSKPDTSLLPQSESQAVRDFLDGKRPTPPEAPATSGYEQAKAAADAARSRSKAAGEAMNSFPKSPNGLTPDEVKASPEWKAAKKEMDAALAEEQRANAFVVKNFPKENRADIQASRAKQAEAPAPIPAGGTVTKDEPPEENKPAAEQAPAPVEPLISAPEEKKSAEQAWSESSPADRRKMLADAGYTDGDQARVLSGTDWADLSDVVRGKIQSPARKPISVTKAGSGATAIVIDPSAMSGREPDLIKQLRENGSVQAEQIEQAKTELAAGDDSLAKDLLRINAPAVNQEPIKNETPAQQGSETAEQTSDQEKFSANRVERAGGFFMDLKDVAKNGDNTQSPWLLSDGRIVGTGQDHISFADQYLPGGAAGYSDFMKETGAVRASFFNDADRGYVATLHVAKGQNLTPEQLGALKFIESQRGAPMVVLLGAADGLVNPEYTETTVSALASDQETAPAGNQTVVAEPKTAAEWAERMAELRKVKPRPLERMYGKNATDDQKTAHSEAERNWNKEYRRASKMQKEALERDNAAFRAKQDEGRLQKATRPVDQLASAEKTEGGERPTSKVEEAGEELTFNRRNRTRSGLKWSDVEGMNDALKAKETVKAKVWPKPDYEQLVSDGMQPIAAHLLKQVYDSVSAKPRVAKEPNDADFKRYIEALDRIQEGVMAWVNNPASLSAWAVKTARLAGSMIGREVSISELTGGKTILDTVYPDGWRNHTAEISVSGGNKMIRALQPGFSEGKKATKDIANGWPASRESWQVQGYKVHPKSSLAVEPSGGGAIVSLSDKYLRSFPSLQEAEKFVAEQPVFVVTNKRGRIEGGATTEAEAIEAARAMAKRESKSGQVEEGMNVADAERIGVERRKEGEDVTAQRLMDEFGFKGVNFGRWVPDNERQLHLNHAFDSFHDIAEILGLPPKALSLNGMLGIAFGAQGGGKALAHFVPGVNEINITRTAGAGSLAHEFGHAIDHYFAAQAGLSTSSDPFMTAHAKLPAKAERRVLKDGKYVPEEYNRFAELRPKIAEAFKAVVAAMEMRDQTPEEAMAQDASYREVSKQNLEKWLSAVRRDFSGVEDQFDKLAERVRNGDYGDGKERAGSHYISPVVADIRDLHKKAKGRVYSLDQSAGLQAAMDRVKYLNDEKRATNKHEPQRVSSNYAIDAARLDKNKGGKGYWRTPWEMFARAFDAYVSDKLAEKSAKNSYLSHAGRSDNTTPQGAERESINKAFDDLISGIEVKEEAGRPVMYSVSDFGDPSPEEAADVAQALAGKSLAEVAEWLSAKHPNEAGRVIADKALEAIRRHEKDGAKTSFRIAGVGDAVSYSLSNGARAETAYSLKRGGGLTIDVTLNGPDVTGRVGTSYETALHEVAHAATTLALDAAEKRAARGMEIEQAFEDLRDVFNFVRMEVSNRAEGGDRQARRFKTLTNMLQNEQEILAWALSNSEAQAFMESIPYQTGNLWTRFVKAIRRILGLAESAETALSEVLRIGEIAFNQSIVPFVQMAGERRNNQINEPNGQRTLVRGEGDARYSVAGSAGFFSALAQFVENAEAKSATADGWMQQIRGQVAKGNVKADEVAWTGVEEWLGTQTGKVPREAVSEFLRANGVQVEETTLGRTKTALTARRVSDVPEGERSQFPGSDYFEPTDWLVFRNGDWVGTYQGGAASEAQAVERYRAEAQGEGYEGVLTGGETKYGNYTLPGGENYREVLLTLPDSPKADSRLRAISDEIGDPNTSEARVGELRAERDRLESDLEKTPVYRSSHWDQSNILAHIRLNDRTDADGKRVLFVEEIQSDWGQDGKKKGFANPNSPVYAVFAKSGAFLKSFEDKADADAFAETVSGDVRAEKRQPGDDSRPPSAPFIDKTDKWVALALKRVIKMAVDEGYDRVAFVTGEQSAARYDLSKHIDRIHYEKSEDGLYELIAYKIGSRDDSTGSEALHEDEIDLARIEELVGKDIAQKIADEAGEKIGGSYRDWRELKNVDLKVGGEGMKAFYDRIVPSVLKDVLKKVGGGTVGVVELQIPGAQPGSRDVATGAVVGPNGTAGQNLDAPGFDITPAMKKKAANGLPLFSAGVGGTLTKPALRDRLTTGLIGPVVSRLIDAGVIVMHKDVSTLPKSIKAVRGMQAATDGKTVHMVASGLTADTARGALFHEFFHTGGEKLIGTEQWGKLMGRLSSLQKQGQQSSGKAREFFDKARARVQAAEQRGAVTEGFAPEEFGAYAIEEYENAPSTVRKWVDDLIGAVKAWALKRFGKQLGDVTPAQLSAIAKMALMDAAAERMIGRPTMMSARGLTDTPAFKRWFKGSKVVDGNGEPLVVYHGTRHSFDEFRREGKRGRNRLHYFSNDPSVAGEYAGSVQYGTPNVMPAFVSLQKPFMFDAGGEQWGSLPMGLFPQEIAQHFDERNILRGRSGQTPRIGFTEVIRSAIAAGYDGVIADNILDGGGPYGEQNPSKVVVATSPEQIKSAIGNRGTFDPGNPDIRYSSRSKTDTPAFRRWFGSSEAVNADGSPMVLYHGTGTDIAVFDPNRTTSIDGIFTTPKARYASQVAAGAGGAPNVMPLYASIQNAARMKAADYTAANVRKAMADRAVDGVIVTDADGNVDTVIVKRPEQLKSVFNGGGFDPGSPDVRYSVSPEQAERVIDEASSALDAAPDLIAKDDYIGRVVGDMSLGARLLVHPRTVASVHPEFTPVYMTAISQIETRDANIADLGTGAAAYSKLDEAGKTAVNKALELGRLMSQTYTADQLTAGVTNKGSKTVVSVGDDGKPRTAIVPVEALLSGAGEVVKLSPDEATAYTDLRAMFDRALDKMRDQTLEELGFPELAGLPNAAREISKLALTETGDKAERLQNIAVFVAEIEQAKRAGYVPFARYGDYVVTVKEKIADLTYVEDDAKHLIVQDVPASFAGDLLDMGAEETPEGWRIKKSQKASVERLTEKTVYSTKVETGLRDFFDERKAGKVDDIAPVREAIEKARAEYVGDNPSRRVVAFKAREKTPDAPVVLSDVDALAEVAQIDNATWDAVRDKLADAIKAKGFRRHFFHSDNVPGYTGDFERAIADYVIGMSGYLARRSHMKQWDNSVTAIKDKPKLFEYASKYRDYVNSPQEEFAMVRQVGFFAYIAGVVASAFANLTQVPMLTLPTLSQIAPVPLVMKEVARAYKDTFKMLGRPGKVGLDMFDPDKAPADVRDALKEAWVEGSFVPLETYDLMMTARQRNVGARKGVKLFNDTTKVVALFFTFAERVNRLVTFIAAARLSEKPAVRANANRVLRNDALARREVLANWGQKSLAEWAVDETQYRMGKANRPTMMRGVGSAIMQFKGYMLQTFEAWYRMSKLHGKEGKFAMAASLVTLYALSGLWGMPGADDLRKLIENIYKQIAKKDLDLKTELRQWIAKMSGSNTLAQIVNKGATYPLGVDLTRVGMGSVVPDSPLAAAGIPFDMLIGRPSRAFEKGSSGDLYGAVAELTPNFMKHWIVAGGWAVDGVRDKQGSRILRPEDLSDSDIGMKALGFQPSIITDVRDYEYAQRRQETAVDALKRRYTNQLAKALAAMETESDPKELAKLEERVAEVYADLDAHNETASEEQQIVIGKRALDNRIQREAEGIKSTWGKERKNARGAAEDLRGVFGLSEEDE